MDKKTIPSISKTISDQEHHKWENGQNTEACELSKVTPEKQSRYERCATLPVFTATYCVLVLFWEAINTYLPSQITSIEREFGISSTSSGTLISSLQYGTLSATLFMNHFSKQRYIPRFLAILAISVGVIIMIPPIIELATLESPSTSQKASGTNSTSSLSSAVLCQTSRTNGSDSDSNQTSGTGSQGDSITYPRRWMIYVIGVCMVLIGVPKSGQIPLCIHYIDNNVADESKTGTLAGTVYTASVLGLPLALLIGSFTSTIPVDLVHDIDTSLTQSDPRWIGAWWLGYFIFAIATILLAIPLFFFPREYKEARKLREEKLRVEKGEGDGTVKNVEEPKNAKELLKSFPTSLFRILSIPVVPCILLGVAVGGIALGGYRAFGPKYLMLQFSVPAWQANISLSVSAGLAAVLGPLLGGYLSTRLKLDTLRGLKFCIVSAALGTLIVSLNLYFGCNNQHIIGLDSALDSSNASLTAESCGCQTSPLLVSCGVDGHTYLSPCYAGCEKINKTIYDRCSLLAGGSVKPGKCEVSCNLFIPFVITMFFSGTLILLIFIPLTIVVLRNVADTDKSLSVSLGSFALNIAGMVPGPIIFGRLIDSSCTKWTGGVCSLYDVEILRYRVVGTFIGIEALCTLLITTAFVIGYRHAKKLAAQPTVGKSITMQENGHTVVSTKL